MAMIKNGVLLSEALSDVFQEVNIQKLTYAQATE